ncbi:cysteine-rich with EGF-like domain protein 2 [Kryptolebias marmoratus]|uniref:Cysteine-rich with EGF-like domains 2 n=1 Tax=Kryptolebias marmoratus TaxID=37003 RepID=A0A3Q2ZF58_KRYMA|nr:cysteine-rich with EGF-like domain protein 2 [Kryptolebias marmoratus]
MMLSAGPELRLLRFLFCTVLVLLFHANDAKKKDLKSACSTCQQITDNFNKGFERTAKQNFGGGNTAWEERKLSKYETSEIRLMEILEELCETSSFDCNHMVEEHEEHFETWWFQKKTKYPDLHKWFCVETIKVCCPKGTFGPDCNACVGGAERPCHGNGDCDGDGTRGGNGKCDCNHGYKGEFCLDCVDGYFGAVKNDTYALCAECHASCKTCSGATNQDCDECKEGWEEDDQEACVDVNECNKEPPVCQEDQHCLNSEGSYSCKACDRACAGCSGPGSDKCQACASGYQDVEGTCTDTDECSQSEPACTKEHQECVNNEGSYVCICSGGYEERDGECVQTQQQETAEESEESQTTSSPHGEL